MEDALSEIVRRHEILRTALSLREGNLEQIVHAPFRVTLPRHRIIPDGDLDLQIHDAVTLLAQHRFDLAEFPYWRFSLLELGPEDHVLVLVQHHVVSDGWSLGILLNELGESYGAFARGEESPLGELPIQYSDYAAWQRERLQGDSLEALFSWWKQQLQDLPASVHLPFDASRPELQSDRGDAETLVLAGSHCQQLREFCGRYAATPFMTLLSMFAILIARYSAQRDFVVGTPTGNREHPDCEGLLGFFLNTLAIRIKLAGDPSFGKLVHQVRATAVEAFAHQDLPFEKLVEELKPERDLSRSPIFQDMFIMHTQPVGELELHDLTMGDVSFESGTSKYDLTLAATLSNEQLLMTLEYCTALFERNTVRRMLRHAQELLTSALATPDVPISTLSMIPADERSQVVTLWNQTEQAFPQNRTIDDLVFAQVRKTPDRIALIDDTTQWSYVELAQRVVQIQALLGSHGVVRGQRIAVYLDRSVDIVAALLAVLRIGAAYVPLDDALPEQRRRFVFADANVALVLTQESKRSSLNALGVNAISIDVDLPAVSTSVASNCRSSASADDCAYIIYTSGSTGTP